MSLSKERREELRRDMGAPRSLEACDYPSADEVRALLDMADERDRYRALLIVAASVLSEDGDTTEADARALYRRISAEMEGKE